MKERRVGLTRNQHRGAPLLKQIGGIESSDFQSRQAAIGQRNKLTTPMKDDTALPLDSDDDSGSDRRNDIKTQFRKGDGEAQQKKGAQSSRPTRLSGRNRSTTKETGSVSSSASNSVKRLLEEDDVEDYPTSLSPKPQPNLGSQHSAFPSSQGKLPKVKNHYGSKRPKVLSSQNQPDSSPHKIETPKKFRQYDNVSGTPQSSPETKRTLIIHSTLDSSPAAPTPKFKKPVDLPSSAKKPDLIKREPCGLSEDDNDDELPDIFERETIQSKNIKKLLMENGKEEASKYRAARFKIYDVPEFTGGRTLQDLGLTQMDLDMAIQDDAIELPGHLVRCPMCKEPVKKTFLEDFSSGERMTVAAQTRFCHSHKTKSANDEWTSRGYPTIDFSILDSRIEQHHQYLRSLLRPDASSYFHEKMTDALKSLPKNKRSLKNVIHSGGTLTPGYYGTRGLRIMSENIMDKFTPQLRELSAKDDLMFAQGVSSFVQTVLVPELAVRLIQEDMQVTTEEAREILKDSAAVGDILQEELDEVVIQRPKERE